MKKFLLFFLVILFTFGCNDTTPTSSSSINLDGFTQTKLSDGVIKVVKYSPEKIPLEVGYLYNGIRTGVWTENWKENGRYHILTSYANDKKNGPQITFNNRGQIEKKVNYSNDNLDGQFGTYKFGRTEMLEMYKNGVLDGDHKEYFKSGPNAGALQKLVQYKNGVQDGKLVYYNEAGDVVMQYVYKNGEKISGGMIDK